MKLARTNLLLLFFVVALVVIPLLFVKNSEFGGSDDKAEQAIQEIDPNYEPWFQPLMEPPGGETESLLFAVQAAIGAGIVGYAVGLYRGRARKQAALEEKSM